MPLTCFMTKTLYKVERKRRRGQKGTKKKEKPVLLNLLKT